MVEKIKKAFDPRFDKVHTWPHLVRIEFLCAVITLLFLLVWSLMIDAPLEHPANPAATPNPSKAPWYFLGLQEMLVYFDPWMAGVVLPSLIIVGLVLIPYIDVNPKGNGYYTFHERKFAIVTYCFGFLILWVSLMVVGVFLRGPGWNFFGPFAPWDSHKVVPLTNIDLNMFLAQSLGLDFLRNPFMGMLFGGFLIVAYYSTAVLYWQAKKGSSEILQKLGVVRYGITAFLFLTMAALPVKMLLRWTFNIKYIMVIKQINLSI
ncbi:MAG: cytochrome C [Deltaproteobacteria bacterium]|nr:cytochrome C [Deltaproteobacteria bacterium]